MSSANSFVEPPGSSFRAKFCLYQPIALPGKQLETPRRNKLVNAQVRDLFYNLLFAIL